jgi:DNA-binding transcriptional MerR regulator
MSIAYRIGAVSRLTGLSLDTLRAWERRYSAVVPKRQDRRRGYNQADVERLILLRRAVEKGHAISAVAKLPDAELHALLDPPGTAARDTSQLIQPLLSALENFDHGALNEQLGRMAVIMSPSNLVDQIVLPVMKEVGDRWHRGDLGVAQEHLMTGLVQHLLGTLMRLYRAAPGAVKLIFATPEGELHTLGIMSAAMLAAGAGLSPIYLGAALPPSELVYAARRSGAKVVVLQINDPAIVESEQLPKILSGLPAGVELWIGGTEVGCDGAVLLRDFDALAEQYRRVAAA